MTSRQLRLVAGTPLSRSTSPSACGKTLPWELYAACNNESSNSEKRQKELKEKLSFATTVSTEQDAVTKKYEEAVKEMDTRVKECKAEYKQQLDDYPGA